MRLLVGQPARRRRFERSRQRESTTSIETATASTNARALSTSSVAASVASTSRARRSAISASIPRIASGQAPLCAGLAHTPAGGSGACVNTASRDAPPDFQCDAGALSNQRNACATRCWTA